MVDFETYILENGIRELLACATEEPGKMTSYTPVDPENKVPCPVQLNDLARLHYLVRKRKAITVLEFGVGYSTIILADAIRMNREEYCDHILRHDLRVPNAFEVHSVDADPKFIELAQKRLPEASRGISHFYYAPVRVGTFNGRICTYYDSTPMVNPDFIYLDAPDQFVASGSVRGYSTAHPGRMPMSGDLLAVEHFLMPGTLIIVDGRTANARFLKANFQRNWRYTHNVDGDVHTFELIEPPLGVHNKKRIEFCLGHEWIQDALHCHQLSGA